MHCGCLLKATAPFSRPKWIPNGEASSARKNSDFFQHNVPLGDFTSLKCGFCLAFSFQLCKYTSSDRYSAGGAASTLCQCSSEMELVRAFQHAHATDQPCTTIGLGSNVLMLDFDGLVVINRIGHVKEVLSGLPNITQEQKCLLKVGAGQSLQQLALATSRLGWSGLEFAAGIPASVGGAVRSNAGAHGQEMSSVVTQVSIMSSDTLEISHHRPKEDGWDWGYRELALPHPNGCITSVSISLVADQSAKERVERNLAHRRATQPVQLPSAGCIFKNPPTGESAGSLLERAGMKGVSVGGACISDQHANFFVNASRTATPDDFLQLITLARDAVRKQTSILLELEVKIIHQGKVTSVDL